MYALPGIDPSMLAAISLTGSAYIAAMDAEAVMQWFK